MKLCLETRGRRTKHHGECTLRLPKHFFSVSLRFLTLCRSVYLFLSTPSFYSPCLSLYSNLNYSMIGFHQFLCKAIGAFPVVLRSPATGFQTQFHVFFGLVSHVFGRLWDIWDMHEIIDIRIFYYWQLGESPFIYSRSSETKFDFLAHFKAEISAICIKS